MKTIRRLYFYMVAFISMEIVLWGLIGLARSIFSDTVGGGTDDLAFALARILVGVPVFGIHWWWAQRNADADAEEQTSGVRAFFLYASIFVLFVPVVQSIWAVLNRLFLQFAEVPISRAIVGGSQNFSDNLIAIIMNALIGAYFIRVLREDWEKTGEKSSLRQTRRIYRYLWVLYALGLSIGGTQQALRYILTFLSDGSGSEEWFFNGLTLLIVGAPLWYWAWSTVQDSLEENGERSSLLRLGVLYLFTLTSVITVLTSAGIVVYEILETLFNKNAVSNLLWDIRGPLSVAIPFGAVWAYYGSWLTRDLEAVPDAPRRAGLQRFYAYLLAAIGLTASFSGVSMLLSHITDQLRDTTYSSTGLLTSALSTLIVGLPLWLRMWRPMQAAALVEDEAGGHARRSIVRKIYLYLAIFAGVVGGMIAAVRLISLLLEALLGGSTSNFLVNLLDAFEMLVLFGVLFTYHWKTLQRDGDVKADEKETLFNVLCLTKNDGPLALQLATAMEKECPEINLIVQPALETESDVHALILPEDALFTNDEKLKAWISQFNGSKFIVPSETSEWLWVRDPKILVNALKELADGESPRLERKFPAWMIAVYILAGLMTFQLLFILLVILLENFGL